MYHTFSVLPIVRYLIGLHTCKIGMSCPQVNLWIKMFEIMPHRRLIFTSALRLQGRFTTVEYTTTDSRLLIGFIPMNLVYAWK